MKTVIRGWFAGEEKQVLVQNGVITKMGDLSHTDLQGGQVIDTGGTLLPGYIDVHVHGGGGAEVMEGTEEAFEHVAYTHAKHGTTGLLLTTVTAHVDDLNRVFRAYQKDQLRNGAEVLGFHLEGPFISPKKPGAQPPEHIILPSVELFRQWQSGWPGANRYGSGAPGLAGAEKVIRYASEKGVVVGMGHCNGSAEEINWGIKWGANSVTHLFNAMTPALHREPGLAGSALGDDRLTVELIADLIHVHPLMLRAAVRAKGPDKVMLITDAVKPADMPEGVYGFGPRQVVVKDGAVRLANGTLAGSTLTLDKAVRNLLHIGAVTPEQVPQVTSANQARLLHLPHGRLAVGAPGSVIAVDKDWNVTHTLVRGRLVYQV